MNHLTAAEARELTQKAKDDAALKDALDAIRRAAEAGCYQVAVPDGVKPELVAGPEYEGSFIVRLPATPAVWAIRGLLRSSGCHCGPIEQDESNLWFEVRRE